MTYPCYFKVTWVSMAHSTVQMRLRRSTGISSTQFYGERLAVKELSLPLW
jgi:hypothetical protein